MSVLDKIVTVEVSNASMPVSTEAFDTTLILNDSKNTVSVATYSSLVALSADYDSSTVVYKVANTAFSQKRRPSKIMVGQCETNKFVEGYTAIKALNNDFYGVVCTSKTQAVQLAVAEQVEADTKIFGCSINDGSTILTANGLHGKLVDKNYRRTFCTLTNAVNEYPEAGVFGQALTYPAGSITWSLKELSGVTGALVTNIDALKTAHCNYVLKLAGRNIFMDGVAINGDYLDEIHGEDKLKNGIQTEIVNCLLSNGKIPFNQTGLDTIQSVIYSAMLSSANDGFLDKETILVRMPILSEISSTDKGARVLNNCYAEAKKTNAIHKIGINVVINL
jgi:hypothetical protein